MTMARALGLAGVALLLAACAAAPRKSAPPTATRVEPAAPARNAPRRSPYAPAQEDVSKRGNYTPGGLYAPEIQDSVPATAITDVDQIPEPDVVDLPHSPYGNRSPYSVLGKRYTVLDDAHGYEETGYASYYGQKFHGRRTSNLEVYDMYAFTAAHRTLPLPSFARVTNLDNGRSVVVRINDRGPFHDGRLIDLSYAAAVKLGVYPHGTAHVRVHGLIAADMADDHQRLARKDNGAAKPGATSARGAVDTGIAGVVAQAGTAATAAGMGGPSATPRDDAGVAPAPSAAKAPSTSDTDWRFDMRQDGRTMTADEFDAWMRARQARVATGRPQPAPPSPGAVRAADVAPAP
ncbi:MAG: septal ring lytic transglycosylase RlpA family protein, partial [Lysobacter sp.]|nr:septal ring lytic transglycosylase RlpA family protein [Lysobacter sp.]